jgi:phosphoglycolate phosphatase
MTSRTRLILFDMDYTLVSVGRQHHEGYRVALGEVYGIDGRPDSQLHQGNTQPNIIRSICQDHGLSRDVIEAGLAQSLRRLSDITISLLDQDLRSAVLPGVVGLLDTLEASGQLLGVVTGRAEAAARVILERSALLRYFSVGAYGDEGDQREDIVRLAIKRATKLHNFKREHCCLVVVGDAPRDLHAARALSARTVAVASGHHTMAELAQCRPDAILSDFQDQQVALDAILGNHPSALCWERP